jgi:hypothetical protein
MKTNTLLNEACELLAELEGHAPDDWAKYRLDDLFNNVIKHEEGQNDETRDIAMSIMEDIIERLGWAETDQPDEEWYPFELQDSIHGILNKALGVKGDEPLPADETEDRVMRDLRNAYVKKRKESS